MRIFSLFTDEALVTGDGIVIKVLKIDDDEVLIGIEHPEGTSTERDDAYRWLQQPVWEPESAL